MLSQKGTQGQAEQTHNRVWLPVPPPIPYCPGRRGLSCHLTPAPLTSIRAPFSLSSDCLALSNSSCISESWSWRSLISVWCCSRSIFTWNSLAGKEAHERVSPGLCLFSSSLLSELQLIKQSPKSPRSLPFSVLH